MLGAREYQLSERPSCSARCFFCESTARAAVLFWPLTGRGELDGLQLYFRFVLSCIGDFKDESGNGLAELLARRSHAGERRCLQGRVMREGCV